MGTPSKVIIKKNAQKAITIIYDNAPRSVIALANQPM